MITNGDYDYEVVEENDIFDDFILDDFEEAQVLHDITNDEGVPQEIDFNDTM